MELNTASVIINFAVKLESDSARFYESVAQRYGEGSDVFLSFAKENKKNRTLVERAYYEVVSDALETGFSFKGLNTDEYLIEAELPADISHPDILKLALKLEKRIQNFYIDTAKQSKSLLADVSRAFERMARQRNERKLKLRSLLEESGEHG